MTIRAQDLYEIAKLNTDAIVGWEAQVAMRSSTRKPLWPGHFTGKRWLDFERGAYLARLWLAYRRGIGIARRSERARQLREVGGITISDATNCFDKRGEQLTALREVVRLHGDG